jgi:SAM-dependent methyltransferase
MSSESITFDRAADYYDQTRGLPLGEDTAIAALIREVGKLNSSSRVMEVGVGTGRIALPLAKLVGQVVGVDLARAMLKRLQSKQTDEPIQVVEGDATRLPFASNSVDAVLTVHIFHLIPTWQQVVNEVARVLRPGGLLIDGGGGSTSFDPLWEIWNQQRPESRLAAGARSNDLYIYLIEQGWRQIGEKRTYEYTFMQAPQVFLDQLQNRVWSSTWKWSNDELADCMKLMRTGIEERFGDPQQETELHGRFVVNTFLPPPS